jgi:exodeoxyribonuclease III
MIRSLFLFAALIASTSVTSEKHKIFKVITYNVWNGFESQKERRNLFVQWAKQQNADVIAFQELNGFTQRSFSELAKTWGHPYTAICKETGYPVGISARYPISNIYKLFEGMHHGCLYAEVKGISFMILHFSPFSSAKRGQEAESVVQFLEQKKKLGGQTIVLGDFNAFSASDSLFYSEARTKDSMIVSQAKNKVLQNLNRKNEIDYTVLSRFLNNGFYDSFSLFHTSFQHSYPSNVYAAEPVSSRCRIDHLLISRKLKSHYKSLEIVRDAVTDTLSDHYPLMATFSLRR